jgi:hypothetical protein
MASLTRRPSLFNLVGSKLPKPHRPFGAGILPSFEDDACHWGSLGLGRPAPIDQPIYSASKHERDYETAYQAVSGKRAEWLTSRPSVPDRNYFDECPELPPSAFHDAWPPDSDTEYWTARTAFDDACQVEADNEPAGHVYWNAELEHLESLLPHATAARRAEIERRIAGVMGMLNPPTSTTLTAESLERQQEAYYQMGLMEDAMAGGRYDGRDWEEQELCRVRGR